MSDTQAKATPSKAAMELADNIFPDPYDQRQRVAAKEIIQAYMADLLEKAKTLQCVFGNYAPSPTCACDNCDFAKALEPWKPGE